MTQTTQAVLRALLEDPRTERYGLEICAATGLPSGTVHPILARLEVLGWVDSAWEQTDPREQGRPRRRYYRFNGYGMSMARDALARAYETRTRIVARLRPAGEMT
jgi:PadR family transcriptional regulator PadR